MTTIEEYFSSIEKAQTMPKTVYHYCSIDSFLSIIGHSTLRLSNITKSNDPTEITNIIPTLQEAIERVCKDYNERLPVNYQIPRSDTECLVNRFFQELSKNFYAFCLSEEQDLLSQWDRYADNATGVAIGFNTRHFVKLQLDTTIQYVFGKVIYNSRELAKYMDSFLRERIECGWKQKEDIYNVNLIQNVIINLICTVLQYSVLFKDSFFKAENEWRLVYNPMGRIRQLGYASAYHDRLLETDQYRQMQAGFIRGNYQFKTIKGGGLSSYIDLNFESIKNKLIQEIVIGPKSALTPEDKDLQQFLAFRGYNLSVIPIEGKLVLKKSNKPFQ